MGLRTATGIGISVPWSDENKTSLTRGVVSWNLCYNLDTAVYWTQFFYSPYVLCSFSWLASSNILAKKMMETGEKMLVRKI